MNATDIFRLIQQIGETSSKNAKVELLKAHKGSENLKRVLKAGLDPLVTYGIKKFDLPSNPGSLHDFDSSVWGLLSCLASREYSGLAASSVVEGTLSVLNLEPRFLLQRIILKDFRAGFGVETVNKVWPGLILDVPYMRCSTVAKHDPAKWNWSEKHFVQLKADGMFVNYFRGSAGDSGRMTTRAGTEVPVAELLGTNGDLSVLAPDTVTHGELLVFRGGKKLDRKTSNGILNHIISGGALSTGETVHFFIWDQIPEGEFTPKNQYKVPYKHRLQNLTDQLSKPRHGFVDLIRTEIISSYAEALKHFGEWVCEGEEGAVLKNANGFWKDTSSGSKDQVKMKMVVDSIDLRIVSFIEGTGKYERMLGSFVMQSEDGQLEVNVNARGDDHRKEVWDNRAKYLNTIASIEANDLIKRKDQDYHSLFLPIFNEHRFDKTKADTLDDIRGKFEAAKKMTLTGEAA